MLGAALLALALVGASRLVGEARTNTGDDAVARAQPSEAEPTRREVRDAGPDASWRHDEAGRLVEPPGDERYVCRQPSVELMRSEGCGSGRPYPHCRWRLPDPDSNDVPYAIWRNTVPMHRWGRPGLVSLVLTAAAEYARRWPGEHLTVGDLDAPGPRHMTHDRGVDVDLYLTEAMMARNEGGGRYPDNYEGRSPREIEALRARVMDLAKILATCAEGRIRIYYNDRAIIRPFRAWFDARGLESDVGPPMRPHNPLHRFHFHVTVAEDQAPLPAR